MITGYDYVFISNIQPEIVEFGLTKMIKKIWENPIIDVCERLPDRLELFVSKDIQMGKYHEEHGFSLDNNNEGCVFFGARAFSVLQGEANVLFWNEPEKLRNLAPYVTNISLLNVWEYTLVLPSEFEESVFCKSIYNGFLTILKQEN